MKLSIVHLWCFLSVIFFVAVPEVEAQEVVGAGQVQNDAALEQTAGGQLVFGLKKIMSCKPRKTYCLYENDKKPGTSKVKSRRGASTQKTTSRRNKKSKKNDKSTDNGKQACGRPAISSDTVALGDHLDCSGYVSAGAALMGLKMSSKEKVLSTEAIEKADCLEEPNVRKDEALQPGDILNVGDSPGHVVVVSESGADPFGIQGMSGADCARINPRNFNFKVLQSTRRSFRLNKNFLKSGPMETHGSQSGKKVTTALVEYARELCRKGQHKGSVVKRLSNRGKCRQKSKPRVTGC